MADRSGSDRQAAGDRREAELKASWDANAAAWTTVVREKRIPSRRAGTDRAIVETCAGLAPRTVLDVGCGEGWLARELALRGSTVTGVDGSAELIARAREAGGGPRYERLDYDTLASSPTAVAGPFDLIVGNASLLAERIEPLLASLKARLAPDGALVVQTLHPWQAAQAEPPYEDGWRTEHFDKVEGGGFRVPMPWYFRTVESWTATFAASGLAVERIREPRDPETARLLSIIFVCRAGR